MAKKTAKRRTQRHNRSGMAIIACVVLILCVVLMYNSVKLNDKLDGYKASVAELQSQIEDQTEMKAALENKQNYMNSEDYYKELARESLAWPVRMILFLRRAASRTAANVDGLWAISMSSQHRMLMSKDRHLWEG